MSATLSPFACDVCGSMEAAEIPVVPDYSGGQTLHTCTQCGFVFAHMRRSDEAIKKDWAESMFGDAFDVEQTENTGYTGYTAKVPAVTARLTYALENFDTLVGFKGKKVCDIGAGEGDFLEMIKSRKNPESVFGVEPSVENCRLLDGMGISCFAGGVEEYIAHPDTKKGAFDFIGLNWTLENTQNARRVIEAVYDLLPVGGYLQVATGSRILVPFKKPLHYYFNPRNPVDLHSFHFSANALCGLLGSVGFDPIHVNRYIDTDYLVVIGKKMESGAKKPWPRDDYTRVIAFFERWKKETDENYL
ncbi:MAG: class I SAM-dependent methyltransferase [Ferrovibrio sp.]|uniref:class I SAM-dependent methyltransferase n=1 Tax=Ferrovibrio sp. TaxID=1917215 RepID=UPI002613FE9D|nr:class I SAM-dependent methyltransferase [Ferrovibrio sp.]MCW0234942.1 class I SAM-dependent methyltransferase [Ferrovibrio sp.]